MGTRADFYVGDGPFEWLGSVGWDGYPEGIPEEVLKADREGDYRVEVTKYLSTMDATYPEMGWPWPWPNSQTTDFAYALVYGMVQASYFGSEWFDPLSVARMETIDERHEFYVTLEEKQVSFPDMTHNQNIRFDGGSGLIIL